MSSLTRLLFILSLLAGAAILACGGGDDGTGNQDCDAAATPRPPTAPGPPRPAPPAVPRAANQPSPTLKRQNPANRRPPARRPPWPAVKASRPRFPNPPFRPDRPRRPRQHPDPRSPTLRSRPAGPRSSPPMRPPTPRATGTTPTTGAATPPGDLIRRRGGPRDRQGQPSGPHRLRRPAGDQR